MNKERNVKRGKLSNEILGLLGISFAVAVFLFEFLYHTAIAITINYSENKGVTFTEIQMFNMELWIQNLSLIISVLFFIVLFLFFLGQKIVYLKSIIKGIEAMQAHRAEFVMPVEGNNELTELAESMNYLFETERKIKQKEKELAEEKEQFIRTLSHDIRTPLTSIMMYTEYLEKEGKYSEQEIKSYLKLVQNKSKQMKELTDVLLDGGHRKLEVIENGRFLMEQLIAEWEEGLEEEYDCRTDWRECPEFSCELDVEEIRRIFDNLYSNIKKYADYGKPVELKISLWENYLVFEQRNNIASVKEEIEYEIKNFESKLTSVKSKK